MTNEKMEQRLAAALDSTADDEGRLVSYKVSGELKDDEGVPVPKSHYNKCGMIVITNYSVGQIDTALRNRAFTQSLDFSTKDLLEIIREIMPNIESNRLSMTSKAKAMNYLEKLVEEGKPIEVSCRSFITCARIYENAVKFSVLPTTVEISTGCENDDVYVRVKDYGCGIRKEDMKKLFDPFYRAEKSRNSQGFGLDSYS